MYLTTKISDALLHSAQAGNVIVLIESTTSGYFKSAATRYKQAWWVGNAVDNNAGTLVYDEAAPVLAGMANDKYGDQSWFRMINGAQTFLMDDWPTLPGSWSGVQNGTYGEQDSCSDDIGASGCPSAFPFPIGPAGVPAYKGVLCCECATEICRPLLHILCGAFLCQNVCSKRRCFRHRQGRSGSQGWFRAVWVSCCLLPCPQFVDPRVFLF